MSGKTLRDNVAFLIIYDADSEMIYLQQKDGTYWRKNERFLYSFVGTGMMPEKREEKPINALKRKFEEEMSKAQRMVVGDMCFWKTFCLERSKSVGGEYNAHVFVLVTNRYQMSDLVYALRSAEKKRASETYITIDRFKQIPNEEFMDSLHIIANEFLKELELGSNRFWESLKKKKK